MRGAIAIAGGGRVGQALGRLLYERGEPVAAVACRRPEKAARAASFIGSQVVAASYSELPVLAPRILIAVPDDAIAEVAASIAGAPAKAAIALHTSGALDIEVLQPLADRGVSCGTLHPLQTVPSPEQGLSALRGIFFAIGGDAPAANWAHEIALLLGGYPHSIPPHTRALYHCAAAMASNYIVALIHAAATLMQHVGLPASTALAAIAPLVEASTHNALTMGPDRALTGPVQRGDLATVARHLVALRDAPPSIQQLHHAAVRHTIHLARLDENKARQLETLLMNEDNRVCHE
jgi:predicted short-subunit dehydrogenase-like oxidoreductase (DUF2520 family)